MNLLSTGIKKIDRAIGGGLLPDSNILIIHETYSLGWIIGFEILQNRIKEGDYGVIMNTTLPLSSLEMELEQGGVDIDELGRDRRLSIIDVFASIFKIDYGLNYVHYLSNFSAETFVPKYSQIYLRILKSEIGDRRPVGLDFTLDGLAFIMGEENTIKVFQRFMALKEKSRIEENRKRPVNIFLLNRGRVSKNFVSWFSLYSHYVLESRILEGSLEVIEVKKSPLVYTPGEKLLKIKKRRGRIDVV